MNVPISCSASIPVVHNIEAIFFDMNGTLRIRELHEPTQLAATNRILELLGKVDASGGNSELVSRSWLPPSTAYWDELTRRYKAYSLWAQENLLQLSEGEIWTRWLLPEYPREQIEPVAAELTLAWGERKGHTVPNAGAEQTIIELKRRGYHLGVISNSISTLDIPRSLEAFGWKDYFEVVVLSSVVKYRKPAVEPFLEAARAMNVEPSHCACIGNRISKDLIGCKRAGFAFGIILDPAAIPCTEQDHTGEADFVIRSLNELLSVFHFRDISTDDPCGWD